MAKTFLQRFEKYLKKDQDLQEGIVYDGFVEVYSTKDSRRFITWLQNNTVGDINSNIKAVKDFGGEVKVLISDNNCSIRTIVDGEGTSNFMVE